MAEPKYVGEIKATLATLVERSKNTYDLCEKLEQHQVIQNGKVDVLEEQTAKNTTNIKWVIRILSGGGIITGITTGAIKIRDLIVN